MTGFKSKKTAALDEDGMYLVHQTKKIEQIKDYAYPCMMAEKALKNVYNLMLEGKSEQAIAECITAIHEIEDIITSIQNAKIKTSTNS
jgi:hypothetical protein